MRLAELYRSDLLPQADMALDSAETWFREGQGSFGDVLETQAAAYDFRLALARAEADLGKTLARLEQLTGSIAPENRPEEVAP